MGIIIISGVILAIAIMVVVSQRQVAGRVKAELRSTQDKTIQLEKTLVNARDELRKSKDELERGRNALKEARDLAKKKLRRHGKDASDQQIKGVEADMTNRVLDESQKALSAMESQIEHLKSDHSKNEEAIRAELGEDFKKAQDQRQEEIEALKKKLATMQEDLKKQKKLMRPEGHKIDLKALPDEAACEFARVFRKAEQHERLHGIARAKLQLAQEKFADLQKRYFSVCRELAVSMGKNEDIAPSEARDLAENIVAGTVEPSTSQETKA